MLDVLVTGRAGSRSYCLVYQKDRLESHVLCEGLEKEKETPRGGNMVILVLRMSRLVHMSDGASDNLESSW